MQAPDFDGVEPEVVDGVTALFSNLVAVVDFALAIASDSDFVVVGKFVVLGCALESFEQVLVELRVLGEALEFVVDLLGFVAQGGIGVVLEVFGDGLRRSGLVCARQWSDAVVNSP